MVLEFFGVFLAKFQGITALLVSILEYRYFFNLIPLILILDTFEISVSVSIDLLKGIRNTSLNSRPLSTESSESNEISALTAGHFSIGGPISSLPNIDYTNILNNRLRAYSAYFFV